MPDSSPVLPSIAIALAIILAIPIISAILAGRKGFAWYLWIFSGGLLGLFVLAFLHDATAGSEDGQIDQQRKKVGDTIGLLLTIGTILAVVGGLALRAIQ